ncbi:hypothetical protein RHSIM_Rhsim08G0104800 [Rhododendron simsii]|uniref:Dof zinc finger protein n=1 Tax=Rhododendron simsii TaxID=118357 RepID=A0A834LED2_RHOSS|nr:hypothetical protein RHSIM_Rhsim08G0104800 [Rhododendron simsii]
MFQELLGGANSLIGGERKPSLSNPFEPSPTPSPSPSPSPSSSAATATPTTPATSAPPGVENQNLRCPRCDSSNTKFCYYNNYNLTQPRHFCKTCRRYWTKGGALRNVPIGGGCRKNKSVVSVSSAANGKSSGGGRFIKTVSSEGGKPVFGGGFDQEIPVNPALWASPAQNSHLLALLRATQSPNPNPSPLSNFIGSMGATEAIRYGFSEVQNNGIHEIYQRLRSTANYYPHDHSSQLLFTASSSSSSAAVLDSAPVSAASAHEMGYWNPTLTCNLILLQGFCPGHPEACHIQLTLVGMEEAGITSVRALDDWEKVVE